MGHGLCHNQVNLVEEGNWVEKGQIIAKWGKQEEPQGLIFTSK